NTEGRDFCSFKSVDMGENLKLKFWECSNTFSDLISKYAGNSGVFVCVIDLSDINIDGLKDLMDKAFQMSPGACRVLVLNKSDQSQVFDNNKIEVFVKENNLDGPFICSAVSGEGFGELKNFLKDQVNEFKTLKDQQNEVCGEVFRIDVEQTEQEQDSPLFKRMWNKVMSWFSSL
ncbi:MAG: hypothetical protein K5907_03780, partial [Treponema sp.]|nr:hypothetical protein [Treponema sp.]